MKTAIAIALGLLATAATIVRWPAREDSARAASPAGRRILYYHDPMHPAYKSDKPGIAPDCGMQLQPVYDDSDTAVTSPERAPHVVNISPNIQHLIGIGVEEARPASGSFTLRLLGRVATDETRFYRVNAAAA